MASKGTAEPRANRSSVELDSKVLAALAGADRALSVPSLVTVIAMTSGERLSAKQIYRVLARLAAAEKVRRVAVQQAYRLVREGEGNATLLLVCQRCGRLDVIGARQEAMQLRSAAAMAGFEADELILEVLGTCADCRSPLP